MAQYNKCKTKIIISRITNYVWNKDYQGLFDYDAKHIQKHSVKIHGNTTFGKFEGKFVQMNDDLHKLN